MVAGGHCLTVLRAGWHPRHSCSSLQWGRDRPARQPGAGEGPDSSVARLPWGPEAESGCDRLGSGAAI